MKSNDEFFKLLKRSSELNDMEFEKFCNSLMNIAEEVCESAEKFISQAEFVRKKKQELEQDFHT